MPQTIPLQPLASQTVQCFLGGQACSINVYQQAFGLYVDLLVSGQVVVQGIIALNAKLIVRNSYFGFLGDIGFLDTLGLGKDPVYTGLGSQFQLVYLSPSEIASLNLPVNVE